MTIALFVLAALCLGAAFGFCWREIADISAMLEIRNGRAS
jgi:hypothetical protein